MAREEEVLDLRIIETYIPAFFTIMKTLAVLGFIPMAKWMGMGDDSIFTFIGTCLFLDRTMLTIDVQAGEQGLIDSNLSVSCVLLCFIVNTARSATAYVDSVQCIVLNAAWCFVALFILVRDEIPLQRLRLLSQLRNPEIIVSAVLFYAHANTPLSSVTVLELSIRAITFQCLSVSWFYTYRLKSQRRSSDYSFTMCIVRFFPVMFVGQIIACVFAGMVWVCIMVKFYQQHADFQAYFRQERRKSPTPDPIEYPVMCNGHYAHSDFKQAGFGQTSFEVRQPAQTMEDDEDTALLRQLLKRKDDGGFESFDTGPV